MSENTNAGGGERYTVPKADHRRRIQAIGAAISRRDWSAVEQAHAEIRDAFDRPDIYDPAALSAQSTGSAGVAAEPAADRWALARAFAKRQAERTAWIPIRDEDAEKAMQEGAHAWLDYADVALTFLAAAPTPPAGGGETVTGDLGSLRKALGDLAELTIWMSGSADFSKEGVAGEGWRKMKPALDRALDMLAAPIINRLPFTASPAGDLNSLSARLHKLAHALWNDSDCRTDWSVEAMEIWKGLDALAPAAPRKGPSEEEIERASAAYYNGMIGKPEDQWPHHDGWAGKTEAFKGKVRAHMARALNAAILTPADRGETQAAGDGWQPISTAPKDGTKFDVWAVHPATGSMGIRFADVQMRGDGTGFGVIIHRPKAHWEYLEDDGPIFPAWKLTHWRMPPSSPPPDQNRGEPDQGGEAR